MLNPETLDACRRFLKSIPDNLNYITAQDLYRQMQADPDSIFILDSRTPEFFNRKHIPGAVNIFLRDVLDEEYLGLLPRDKKIVVCCWVGHTASQLLTVLQLLGYDAVGLKYGMGEPGSPGDKQEGWLDLNLPIE
jgi:rhodanese-related sulfurtransferase